MGNNHHDYYPLKYQNKNLKHKLSLRLIRCLIIIVKSLVGVIGLEPILPPPKRGVTTITPYSNLKTATIITNRNSYVINYFKTLQIYK